MCYCREASLVKEGREFEHQQWDLDEAPAPVLHVAQDIQPTRGLKVWANCSLHPSSSSSSSSCTTLTRRKRLFFPFLLYVPVWEGLQAGSLIIRMDVACYATLEPCCSRSQTALLCVFFLLFLPPPRSELYMLGKEREARTNNKAWRVWYDDDDSSCRLVYTVYVVCVFFFLSFSCLFPFFSYQAHGDIYM